jgi:hypothetical protein
MSASADCCDEASELAPWLTAGISVRIVAATARMVATVMTVAAMTLSMLVPHVSESSR